MWKMTLIILSTLSWLTMSQNYSISLNDPFLISSQSNISYISNDLSGNYFIQFVNGTVAKYNPTLTTSQVIAYP